MSKLNIHTLGSNQRLRITSQSIHEKSGE